MHIPIEKKYFSNKVLFLKYLLFSVSSTIAIIYNGSIVKLFFNCIRERSFFFSKHSSNAKKSFFPADKSIIILLKN
jgi:hypothetical protein